MRAAEWFKTLCKDLAEGVLAGYPPSLPGHRLMTESYVEALLSDKDSLLSHLCYLTQLLSSRQPFTEPLPDVMADAVYSRGLSALPDEELGALILNPFGLVHLFDRLNFFEPPYWLDLKKRLVNRSIKDTSVDKTVVQYLVASN